MLSHADPEPVRGIMVILLLYVAKFFVKYKNQNIFNPVVFTVGSITLLALIVPAIGISPLDFTGIDIRFPIFGLDVPLPLLPIILALTFNIARLKRHPLALSFIFMSLILGYFINAYENDIFSYLTIIIFTGTAVITEPKTSPSHPKQQVIYGITMALLIYLLTAIQVPNPIAIGLFFGNICWFIYKQLLKR